MFVCCHRFTPIIRWNRLQSLNIISSHRNVCYCVWFLSRLYMKLSVLFITFLSPLGPLCKGLCMWPWCSALKASGICAWDWPCRCSAPWPACAGWWRMRGRSLQTRCVSQCCSAYSHTPRLHWMCYGNVQSSCVKNTLKRLSGLGGLIDYSGGSYYNVIYTVIVMADTSLTCIQCSLPVSLTSRQNMYYFLSCLISMMIIVLYFVYLYIFQNGRIFFLCLSVVMT